MIKRIISGIIILVLSNIQLHAEDIAATNKNEAMRDPSITIGGMVFSLEQAIDIVIQQNLTLQSAKYDVVMSDTAYEKAQKKYSTNLNLESGYLYQEQPASDLTGVSGTKQWQYDAGISISKLFSTGTTISAGVKEVFFDANDQGKTMPLLVQYPDASLHTIQVTQYVADPAYHKPVLFASIQQELLKNAFGYSDKKLNKILENTTQIQRSAIINQLSGLVVSALVDYWNVTIQKSAMDTANLELDSNLRVLNIIKRNANYGLSEKYDINQYNALVAGTEARYSAAKQKYTEAVRKLLRTVNLPSETQVTGVTNLVDILPDLNQEAALKAGFEKRVDYKNTLLAYENAKIDLDLQENQALPSLTVSASISNQSQDTSFGKAFNQAASSEYPSYQVRAKVTYPLDDSDLKASVRNANFKLKQADINIKNMKLEVRDDILNKLDQVKLMHEMLMKMHIVNTESQAYYQSILRRFEQGKVNSVTMKFATDSMVQARKQELEALVQYNVAVLLFDLSKNEIFERYHVDVEKYLKSVK